MTISNIGKNVARLRKAKGKTAEQLAEALNVSRQTVSKWENGETVPNAYNVLDMATYLDTSVLDIYGQIMIDRIVKDSQEEHEKKSAREFLVDGFCQDLDVKKALSEAMTAFDRNFIPFNIKVGLNTIYYEDILRKFNTGYVMGFRECDYPVIVQRLKSDDFIVPAIVKYLNENNLYALAPEGMLDGDIHIIVVIRDERDLLRFKELIKIFFTGLVKFDDHAWLRELFLVSQGALTEAEDKSRFSIFTFDSKDEDMQAELEKTYGLRLHLGTANTEDDLKAILKRIASLGKANIESLLNYEPSDTIAVIDWGNDTMKNLYTVDELLAIV